MDGFWKRISVIVFFIVTIVEKISFADFILAVDL